MRKSSRSALRKSEMPTPSPNAAPEAEHCRMSEMVNIAGNSGRHEGDEFGNRASAANEIAAPNWEAVSICAQRMIMAWDQTEEEEEARGLVTYATKRQRALIFKALWDEADPEWRSWARKWLMAWHERNQ